LSVSLPKFVRPCIPTTAKAIPRGAAWLHEPKFDGYRFQIVKDRPKIALYSRNGREWTKRLPEFAAAFLALPCRFAVLDGELVLPDEDGVADFFRLHASARLDPRDLVFFAFDLLHRDGKDLRVLPLCERRRRLLRLVVAPTFRACISSRRSTMVRHCSPPPNGMAWRE
jgi:bifunctional non-homologous end joining protein LigD